MKVVPAIVSMLGMLGVSQGRTKKQTMESIGESDKGPSLSNLLREGVRLSKIEHDRNMLRYEADRRNAACSYKTGRKRKWRKRVRPNEHWK